MALVNLCKSDITVLGPFGRTAGVLPRSDDSIWCDIHEEVIETEEMGGCVVPIIQEVADNIVNLPEPEKGVFYIVPRRVALALFNRSDVVFPVDSVRDPNGRITACRKFRMP